MQIYVCVKHVPDTAAAIKVTDDTGYNEANVKFIVNPYDEYAVEEAVRIREKDKTGEIVVVCVGPAAATGTIRSALAMGPDRAIHVKVEGQFTDSITTSKMLKAAIALDGTPDLVIAGKGAVDTEGFQTAYRLAHEMNLPVVNEVAKLSIEDGKAVVEREVGGGSREVLEMAAPCVIGATKGLNEPRYPKFPDIMKAKKKEIREIDPVSLDIDMDGGGIEILKLEPVPERSAARILEGDLPEQVNELVRILGEEEKVI